MSAIQHPTATLHDELQVRWMVLDKTNRLIAVRTLAPELREAIGGRGALPPRYPVRRPRSFV